MKRYLIILFTLFIIFSCNRIRFIKEAKEVSKKDFLNSIIKNQLIVDSISLCAERFQLQEELILAIIYYESKFDEKALNDKNQNGTVDVGLMQLNSETFSHLTIAEMYDIECNIFNGTKLLRELKDKYCNNDIMSICAYNCGGSNVERGKIPEKTLNYADKVLSKKSFYEIEFERFKHL